MKEFLKIVLGTDDGVTFFALFFFALLGALLSVLLQSTQRDPKSNLSPVHFSWLFFLRDNAKRFITGMILIYVFLRFTTDLTGLTLTNFIALVIGFGNDKLAQILKDKTNLLGQKKD
jgi:hypothetical protein